MKNGLNTDITNLLTLPVLCQMADGRTFERGKDYFERGLVGEVIFHKNTLTAKVRGTQVYKVKFWVENNKLTSSCTCPAYAEGGFCKHCVSVGLKWLDGREISSSKTKSGESLATMDDVKKYLDQQEKKELVDMLLEQAVEDDRLRERLLMKSTQGSGKNLNLSIFRKAIDNAVHIGYFIDYKSVWDYTRGIEEVIDSIEGLLEEGFSAEVIELTEYFLLRVEQNMGNIDDSDGGVGGILNHLQEIHHKACLKAKPNPEELARKLFEWELKSDWEVFFNAASTYADILGEKGLAVYRKLAEQVWPLLPALKHGQDNVDRNFSRFRITHIMETLAKDTEELVSIKSHDLSSPYSYLNIAEIYRNDKQYDMALKWAEDGIKAFPDKTDSRLREFLADEYHRKKRHGEAMELIWGNFAGYPQLDEYKKLKEHADKIKEWAIWRKKALDYLHQVLNKNRQSHKEKYFWWNRNDNSELVKIFLWERDIESAWQEAKTGGCSNELWLELASLREKEYPQDAISIYQKQIEVLIEQKNNSSYQESVKMLKKIQKLMQGLNQNNRFDSYLSDIRARHKPKRNLIKFIDSHYQTI